MRLLFVAILGLSVTALAAQAPRPLDAGTPDASLPVEAPDAGPAVNPLVELERRLEALERRTEEVQRQRGELALQVEVLEQQHAKDVAAKELSTLGVKVGLGGFLQTDFTWRQSSEEQLDPATREPLNQTRFLVRRARLRPKVEYGPFSASLEADFNTVAGAQVRLVGAEVSAAWELDDEPGPVLKGTVGLFKTPFGFEVLQSDRVRVFLERSNVVRALFPGEYDLGVRAQGEWRFLRYAVALMNGKPIGEKLLQDKAPLAPRDVVGRVGVDAEFVPEVRLEAGFSALVGSGFHPGSAATKDQLTWRDLNGDNQAQASELAIISGQPAQPSSTFGRQAVGGDVHLTLDLLPLGRTHLMGELVWSKNLDRALSPSDPVASGRDLRGLGWHAGLTQELTPSFVLGVRYDRYNPDLDALESRSAQVLPRDQTFSTLAVVAGFVYRPLFRLLVEYDHNLNPLGRDATGQPTTLLDDSLTVRAEVQF
jgi:hypothetical protein